MLKLAHQSLSALGKLPRDSRDTLFLLVVIAWVLLPQVERLPLWCSLGAAAVLLRAFAAALAADLEAGVQRRHRRLGPQLRAHGGSGGSR